MSAGTTCPDQYFVYILPADATSVCGEYIDTLSNPSFLAKSILFFYGVPLNLQNDLV
jgi:hypothetical protein